MKKALINPNQVAEHIIFWVKNPNGNLTPIYEAYPNSQLVCDVVDQEFPIAAPLFWADCENNVEAYRWYLNASTNQINAIEDAPQTQVIEQPITTGTQTL